MAGSSAIRSTIFQIEKGIPIPSGVKSTEYTNKHSIVFSGPRRAGKTGLQSALTRMKPLESIFIEPSMYHVNLIQGIKSAALKAGHKYVYIKYVTNGIRIWRVYDDGTFPVKEKVKELEKTIENGKSNYPELSKLKTTYFSDINDLVETTADFYANNCQSYCLYEDGRESDFEAIKKAYLAGTMDAVQILNSAVHQVINSIRDKQISNK